VTGVKLQVMELGAPAADGRRSPVPVEGKFEYLELDTIISAIGQKVDTEGFGSLSLNRWGIIEADETTFRTNLEGVFAVGDATNRGASIAIAAIGEADKAAEVIHSYLNGAVVPYEKPYVSERDPESIDFTVHAKQARIAMPTRPAEERRHDFLPVNLGFDADLARQEAARCLECGCHDYAECKLICHARRYPIDPERFAGSKHPDFVEQRLEVIERNQGKCILCNLCVRVCEEQAKQGILGLVGRGFTTVIKPEFRDRDVIAVCKDCKLCEQLCPTGALKILG